MTWLWLSLISAGFESLKDVSGKQSAQYTNQHTSAFMLHATTFLVTTPVILMMGIPTIQPIFWWGTLAFIPLTPLWTYLYLFALRHSPLSTTTPILALNPIFTLLFAAIATQQAPTLSGTIGIGLISLGFYVIHYQPHLNHQWYQPILLLWKDRGVRAMLGVAVLWSLGAIFAKWRVMGSNAWLATWSSSCIGLITSVIIAKIQQQPIKWHQILTTKPAEWGMSLSYFLANLFSSFALQLAPTEYVHAVKRSSLIGSSLVGFLVFKEIVSGFKIVGLGLVVAGVWWLGFGW